ncbi:carboxymethylenebutenolidase [Polymorphobacter fuscus]|nr:carboxymethylenebutenolidase [Polymorphobacter fuscus]
MTMNNELPPISQAMIAMYDHFTHVGGSRRDLITGMARLAGGTAAALALLPLIEARADARALTSEADPRITAERIVFTLKNGVRMAGYIARPTRGGTRAPRAIVIHENRGLTDHIRDVTRRLALSGIVALAPDFLTPLGETPRTGNGTTSADDIARQLIGTLDPAQTVTNAVNTVKWLDDYSDGNGVPGAVGFCWGGGLVNNLAIAAGPALRVGVAYYGPAPADLSGAARVKARMMLHFAGLDERINAGAAAWADALKAAGVKVEAFTYPGVNHAFNNDTSAARFDQAAADLAWGRTLEALKQR